LIEIKPYILFNLTKYPIDSSLDVVKNVGVSQGCAVYIIYVAYDKRIQYLSKETG
jgi:hypothetical protein